MPLEYGGMDSESSPSSSERTVEVVRGDEVVGVGGDSVPITVVEVEGRRERCYDVDADIVEEVKQYRSELETRDSLGYLVENYEISSRVLIRPAGVEERACSAPRDHWMPIAECIEAAELYGPSALSEAEMDKILSVAGGVAIPKKPRKKSKTSTKQVDEGGIGKEVVPSTSAGVEEEVPRLELKRKGREERGALQKKKKVVEEEERGSEVPLFIPRPPPVELDSELKEFEGGAEVRAPGEGKGLVPPLSFQSSLFEAKNMTGARRFINSTFLEVDKRHARDEALRYCGASMVKHVLECDQLQKEKEELEKKNKEMQEALDEVVPAEKEIKLMKEAVVELKKNVQLMVHNGMEEHISNFISSSSFDNIVNLYRLPTAILAFTDCRKKVNAEYLEVDITKITFGEQEEGVEENGESMSADFHPQIKLRWDRDVDGRTVFPPNFDFEFVAVEEEEAEVEEDEVGARVEGTEVDESQPAQPVEIHPVPSDDEQPPLLDEQQPTQPPLPTEQEPVQQPPPAEKSFFFF
ncbi:hypothetical protein SLEP1_g40266 [Rubroshorea leprosula]|uniref:Uncharacterized protein n=1 Tax=Rubroshorea leprosula TaxID=152421 RepID=A0AAV5L358_9ROSI|nr:hypothetical protein SLEP1_g40266 [Rubroshorea leprosula]